MADEALERRGPPTPRGAAVQPSEPRSNSLAALRVTADLAAAKIRMLTELNAGLQAVNDRLREANHVLQGDLARERNYHTRRVTELLEANNREVERRRAAEAAAERRGIKPDGR